MKVVIDYDPASGNMTDAKGAYVGSWMGLESFGEELSTNDPVEDIVKLKNSGFTAEDIVAMKKGGVL